MTDVLADTHTVIWYLFDPDRLSAGAVTALAGAARGGTIFVSAMTLVELSYLAGKKSFPYTGVLSRLLTLITDPSEPIDVLPVTLEVALAMDRVPRGEVPDMPDRIIAATAVAHNLPLVSVDSDIQGSAGLKALVPVIW